MCVYVCRYISRQGIHSNSGFILSFIQVIRLWVEKFTLLQDDVCSLNQLIIYHGDVADDTMATGYCRKQDLFASHDFPASTPVGFRFWSHETKENEEIGFMFKFDIVDAKGTVSPDVIRVWFCAYERQCSVS